MKNFQMRKFSVRFLACKLVKLRSFLYEIKREKNTFSSNISDVHRCEGKHLEFCRLKAANFESVLFVL